MPGSTRVCCAGRAGLESFSTTSTATCTRCSVLAGAPADADAPSAPSKASDTLSTPLAPPPPPPPPPPPWAASSMKTVPFFFRCCCCCCCSTCCGLAGSSTGMKDALASAASKRPHRFSRSHDAPSHRNGSPGFSCIARISTRSRVTPSTGTIWPALAAASI